jgi:hypothetical protein
MKRTIWQELPDSVVYCAVPCLGGKTVLPSFTTLDELVSVLQAPLSPSVLDITQEKMEFISWVDAILKENSAHRRRRYYRKYKKDWSAKIVERESVFFNQMLHIHRT